MIQTKEIQVSIGGTSYVLSTDDNYLEAAKGGFEPEMVKLYRSVANGSRLVLDIGANIGCTALLFSEIADSVYAFEPSPSTYHFLSANSSRTAHKNIFPQNIGLGAQESETTLTFAPANRSGGYISNQTAASAGHTVETVRIQRLDDFVHSEQLYGIDFIKIDVEGFEGSVLRGATSVLSEHKPNVVLELNHWCLNAFQRTSIPDFFDHLRQTFPILLAIDGSHYMNLHDASDSYIVMYHHILKMRFPNILASYNASKLSTFYATYRHGFVD